MSHRYFNNCVNWNPADVDVDGGLCDLVDSGEEITHDEFVALVNPEDLQQLSEALGYNETITLKGDYHVSYYTGALHGVKVIYLVHSAIEYVFVDTGVWSSLWNQHQMAA